MCLKKNISISFIFVFLVLSGLAFAQAPKVSYEGRQPGLLVLFEKDGEPVKIEDHQGRSSPVFGRSIFQQGSWDFMSNGRSASTTGGALRYRTTDFNGNYQSRSVYEDWVVQLKYKHTGAYNYDAAWYIKHWQSDAKLIELVNKGSGDNWSIYAGDNNDSWYSIADDIQLGTDYNTFTFVFKADGLGGGTVDAYINDNLIAEDVTFGHGNYAVDYIQLQGIGAGTDFFEFIKIGDKKSRFAHQWVQNNEFTLQALVTTSVLSTNEAGINLYRDTGFSSLLIWNKHDSIFVENETELGLPWHFKVSDTTGDKHETKLQGAKDKYLNYDNEINSNVASKGIAFVLPDEPVQVDSSMNVTPPSVSHNTNPYGMVESFEFKREFKNWLRDEGYPEKMVWGNLSGHPESQDSIFALYDGVQNTTDAPTGYSYEQFVENYFHITGPDIVSFDYYPFDKGEPETQNKLQTAYFRSMETIRSKALEQDTPYFAMVQSFWNSSIATNSTKKPTEWDIRMNVNSLLAYGFKGIVFFLWNSNDAQTGLVGPGGSNDAISDEEVLDAVKRVTTETKHLGKVLKHLKSTGVRYVRGKDQNGNGNPLPDGTTSIDSPETCTASYLTSVNATVTNRSGQQEGDLLLACFTPDEEYDGTEHEGVVYFMIVNLYRSMAFTSQAKQDVTLTFDFGSSGISALQRLNHVNGEIVDQVDLTHDGGSRYHATFDLVGGEAYLFKYKISDENFIKIN